MKNSEDFISRFLNDLETNLASEMEINNLNFEAEKELIYKEPISLN